MPQRYIKKILDARVYDVAIETPLTEARSLSKRFGNNIMLKREDLQPVFSFKIRGAYNRIAQLSEEQKAKGVICASAGNHAQGVALAARDRPGRVRGPWGNLPSLRLQTARPGEERRPLRPEAPTPPTPHASL